MAHAPEGPLFAGELHTLLYPASFMTKGAATVKVAQTLFAVVL